MNFSTALYEAFSEHASLPAVSIAGNTLSYGGLRNKGEAFAARLSGVPPGAVGIFAPRSVDALSAIAGSVIAERAYVPLNPKFPDDRLREIVARSGCSVITSTPSTVARIDRLLPSYCTNAKVDSGAGNGLSVHHVDPLDNLAMAEKAGDFAYIMFTSGSTGHPKGIGITPQNLAAYLAHAVPTFGLEPGNRASQMFELSFDLSVHDIFVTWMSGGELCLPGPADMLAPGHYIQRNKLTHWFSVPSVAVLMGKLGMLKEGAFPSIRQSLFCGEALPQSVADTWSCATPNSSVWNLYGPTEATIAITSFEWQRGNNVNGSSATVPIGGPFPEQYTRILRHEKGDLVGELCLSGDQLAPGYLDQQSRSAAETAFHEFDDDPGRTWYRTGDLVTDDNGLLRYRGRLDSQVQIMGHRVELGEIEVVLRSQLDGAPVAVIAREGDAGNIVEIVAFVEANVVDADDIRKNCARQLPDYMLPKRIIAVSSFPLNTNGKTDRNALKRLIHE